METRDPWHRQPILRFLVVGGSNTLITAGIVVVLSFFLPGPLAFTIAFALGIAYALMLTGRWVFRSRLTAARAALFTASYVGIYLCGLAFVMLMGLIQAPPWANGASVFITAPLSFMAGHFIFNRSKTRETNYS